MSAPSSGTVPPRPRAGRRLVAPDERTAAAGLLSVATDLAGAAALALAGLLAQAVAPGWLFVIAGVGRIGYNTALYLTFRHVRPPEGVGPDAMIDGAADRAQR